MRPDVEPSNEQRHRELTRQLRELEDSMAPTPPEPGRHPRIVREYAPGEGGWTPPRWGPVLAAALVFGAIAVADSLGVPTMGVREICAAGLKAAAGAIGTYLGIKSAGPRLFS